MRKYLTLLRTSLINSFVYRVDFLLWGISELIDTLVFLFIWIIIFGEKQAIGGFSLQETITYLIGVGLISNITFSWVGYDIEQDVRTGRLSGHLIKPMIVPLARFCDSIAEKPFDILIRILVYITLALFFQKSFILNTDLFFWLLFALSILFSFVLSNLINFCLGCVSFWTITSRGTFGFFRTITAVFSGGYAPITFFPLLFQKIASLLPFVYLRYFPMLIYLGKVSTIEAVKGIGVQIIWVVVLYFLAKTVWRRGIRKYEGVGI